MRVAYSVSQQVVYGKVWGRESMQDSSYGKCSESQIEFPAIDLLDGE
jgi:hypothetical protein